MDIVNVNSDNPNNSKSPVISHPIYMPNTNCVKRIDLTSKFVKTPNMCDVETYGYKI